MNGEVVSLVTVQECLSISLKILLTLLSWNELKGSDQKELRLVSKRIDSRVELFMRDVYTSLLSFFFKKNCLQYRTC